MQKDFIIVGQGAAGTFLSWYLLKEGFDIIVIDQVDKKAASYTAAGMINPVTGRRIVKSWIIDEIMPFAFEAYSAIGRDLNITAIQQKNIINFFPNDQMREAFEKRIEEKADYMHAIHYDDAYKQYFNYHHGYGEIEPGYLVSTHSLFKKWRKELDEKNLLLNEQFDFELLQTFNDNVSYKDITAGKIIFCEGAPGYANPWFPNLPFASNKGQALLVELKDLPTEKVFKKTMKLVPLGNDIFWAGASYEWNHTNLDPTEEYLKATVQSLEQWLKIPVKVVEHIASLRPATLERRPFVGFHPAFPMIGIFNGLGTKGFSLAPYFANEFVQNIAHGKAIHPLADVSRFEKTLARKV
jgi:glycine/D-amino acid oxidase-like deaminating enzyme